MAYREKKASGFTLCDDDLQGVLHSCRCELKDLYVTRNPFIKVLAVRVL